LGSRPYPGGRALAKKPGKGHERGVETARPLGQEPLGPWRFEPIGWIESPFQEKFGIPRQSGLVRGAKGVIRLRDHDFLRRAIEGLEGFSHLWAIWIFHEHDALEWKPSIRPPRLGGARRVGVLASRSPHRPNPIGLSAMKILSIDASAQGGPRIEVEGVDVLDGTPLLDLKPYLPYADSFPEATSGWASEQIARTPVEFEPQALEQIQGIERSGVALRSLIIEVLELDPRPAFQKRKLSPQSAEAQGLRFGFELLDYDVRWEIRGGSFWVLEVVRLR
jgi:tRNA-Thr(GGU) m(6)t(6)A37 methyltransferase TsaA